MYHILTDEIVILGVSLSHFRDVNKSQSDGLTPPFFNAHEGVSYQYVIHFPLSQSGK